MNASDFDPTAPLPAPPEPWAASDQPSRRAGPPYHMTDMIAAEPHLARRILARLTAPGSPASDLARAVRDTLGRGRPVVLTGCGTSEHGALGSVEILRAAVPDERHLVTSAQAFELALAPPSDGLVIGISHEGGTAATNRALEMAKAAGARTALITAGTGSPGASIAEIVVPTGEMDQSWCHTVGYVSPLLASAATTGHLVGRPLDAERIESLMAESTRDEAGAEAIAAQLEDVDRLIVVASGADRVAGRELVLKVEEACWLPSAYRDLETFLHGHLPATDERTGLVLLLTERDDREARAERARQALAASRALGHRAAAILAAGADGLVPADLTPAGRTVVPDAPDVPAPVASLLTSAMALQLVTERLARARGTNPDPIRRDDPRYAAAAAAADG
jgi:glucosamine--fructose-6-phosphate aminotransferase (isomerizing)